MVMKMSPMKRLPEMVRPQKIETIDEGMAEVLRKKTPVERLQIACGFWISARRQLSAVLMADHPDWPLKKVAEEVSKRLSHGPA